MSNLDFLEREMKRRVTEAEEAVRRDHLVRLAQESNAEPKARIPVGRAIRVRLGTMLIRLGTRMAT